MLAAPISPEQSQEESRPEAVRRRLHGNRFTEVFSSQVVDRFKQQLYRTGLVRTREI
jgi:hypothetical protein